jgi:hypothetical protein
MNDAVQLQDDDARAVGDAVERYARLELGPLFARPERAPGDAACRAAIAGLADLGVLSRGADGGWGIWDDDRAPLNRQVSLRNLQSVARQSAALAYQLHLQAMAGYLDRLAGADGTRDVCLAAVHGHLGLGREAFVRSVAGAPLTRDERAMLADNWRWPALSAPRWLHALPDWTALWVPTWSAEAGWTWRRLERASIDAQPHPHSHGLDELTTQAIVAVRAEADAAATAALSGDVASNALRAVTAMDGAALLALSQAAAEVAWGKAHDYARTRYQGGRVIAGHAAVQQLLSRALGAAQEASAVLTRLGSADAGWPDLRSLWRDRARCQVSLSAGASAALQVFGGMGYMRDNALEKLLRAVNHLRLLGGSPAELTLCVAHWDTLLADPVRPAAGAAP